MTNRHCKELGRGEFSPRFTGGVRGGRLSRPPLRACLKNRGEDTDHQDTKAQSDIKEQVTPLFLGVLVPSW